jgi:hypothetical protein
MWACQLKQLGWNDSIIKQFSSCIAESTLKLYNRLLKKLYDFCQSVGVQFPPEKSEHLASFLFKLAHSSARPQSQLNSALAACSHAYSALGLNDITQCQEIRLLKTALIKSSTTYARSRTPTMPKEAFADLFESWEDNSNLSTSDLRLKAITLLALSVMLRPSDIAPKGKQFSALDNSFSSIVFSTDQLVFRDDGGCK